ncbi:MAG: arginine decarboxylase, partial [Cyanobacteria bacterium J06633_1]
KLSTQGSGRWGASTGDRAKFGLTARQILQAIDMLRAADCLDCLKLLHFHIGSQISAIGVIKDALREAAQLYVELHKLGANLQYLDVGGGLAVDYDGSKTNSSASKNYNMQNYANDIVAAVRDACRQGNVPAPILVSESGRAISAHQAILICDVLGKSDSPSEFPPHTAKE